MEANVRLLQRSLERGRIAAKQVGAGIQDAGPGLLARQLFDDRGRLFQLRIGRQSDPRSAFKTTPLPGLGDTRIIGGV